MKNYVANLALLTLFLMPVLSQANTGDPSYTDIDDMVSLQMINSLNSPPVNADYANYNKIAIDGRWAMVPARYDDEMASDGGAVYVYHRDAQGLWSEHSKLMLPNAIANDHFGNSVSISGTTAIIGAPYRDTGSLSANGAVYLYKLDTNNDWIQVQEYAGTANNQLLGLQVDIHDHRLVASSSNGNYLAEHDESGEWPSALSLIQSVPSATEQIAIMDDLLGLSNSGTSYLYQQDITTGNWVHKTGGSAGSVALEPNLFVVGVKDFSSTRGGVAFFEPNGSGAWSLNKVVTGAVSGAYLGSMVSIADSHVLSMSKGDNKLYVTRKNAAGVWQTQINDMDLHSYYGLGADDETAFVYINDNGGRVAAFDMDAVSRSQDNCPYHINANQIDNDADGLGDICDADSAADSDGDGAINSQDLDPFGGQIMDNDGDGVEDSLDAFPTDAAEILDTDGDGIGNNADTDDDGDGVVDSQDAFPLDATQSIGSELLTDPVIPTNLHIYDLSGNTYVDLASNGCSADRFYIPVNHIRYDVIISILLTAQISKKEVIGRFDGCNGNTQGKLIGVYLP